MTNGFIEAEYGISQQLGEVFHPDFLYVKYIRYIAPIRQGTVQ